MNVTIDCVKSEWVNTTARLLFAKIKSKGVPVEYNQVAVSAGVCYISVGTRFIQILTSDIQHSVEVMAVLSELGISAEKIHIETQEDDSSTKARCVFQFP